jgi:protein-tyrosine phosphatase
MLKKIIGNLYLGNHHTVLNDDLLKRNNINIVINCTKNSYNINRNITHVIGFPSYDPPSNEDFIYIILNIDKLIFLIDNMINNNKKVIIFCHRGQHRSVTLCIVYLMYRFKISSMTALHIIKYIHPESFSYVGASTYYLLKYFDMKYGD